MGAMFLAKRATINIYKASYNNSARSIAEGVTIISNSRYFASHGNNEREKPNEDAMGTTRDGKAPNVTMSHATDTLKEGLKRATEEATEKSGDASKPKSVENDDEGDEENVAVGEDGTSILAVVVVVVCLSLRFELYQTLGFLISKTADE